MKKIELHAKTKYGYDYDSVIDIESLLWNAEEQGEKGLVFADKDSCLAFPKIEQIYNKLCLSDKSFYDFKIGYGVELTVVKDNLEQQVVILVQNQQGLKNLYKIMSLYENKISIHEVLKYRNGLLIGLILNDSNINLDLSMFDYLEINNNLDVSSLKNDNIIIFSNNPNSLMPGDIKAFEVLYFRKNINKEPKCRLYLDTKDTLSICNDEELVITNTNLIFDKLDNIVINDGEFNITHLEDYDAFASLVKTSFKNKYKNPSLKLKERLEKELNLIKELDYTYYFKILKDITEYCKHYHEYYCLDGYINNSLVAYVLDITNIEPFNLPYELFFSQIPSIELHISPKFYHEKLFAYVNQKCKLLRSSSSYQLNPVNLAFILKHYERYTNKHLSLRDKDYLTQVLNHNFLCKSIVDKPYFIIPNNKEIEDFTPIENINTDNTNIKTAHFDYNDLRDNLLRIKFILSDDVKFISNLNNKTKTDIKYCNDKNVYDLFRDTSSFNTNFKILDQTTGLLNIKYFSAKDTIRKLKRIPNLWFEDLINVLAQNDNLIIVDDLYQALNNDLEDLALFNVINYLKQTNKKIISKATLINKVKISYMQMYYKLYYPRVYYQEMLDNYNYTYVDKEIFSYDLQKLEQKYLELSTLDKTWMKVEQYQEFGLLEILMEMYERQIYFKIDNGKVVVK